MCARPILATIFRKNIAHAVRHYARVDTAFPRAVQILMQHGEPGDVVEFAHSEHGFQIGTVKIHVGGKINVKWTILEKK